MFQCLVVVSPPNVSTSFPQSPGKTDDDDPNAGSPSAEPVGVAFTNIDPGRLVQVDSEEGTAAVIMFQGLATVGIYHKLSMDHGKCKNAIAMGNNTASWHKGTCQSVGYTNEAPGSFFGTKRYVKPGPAVDYSHYKIPTWADPHYSASGNDRNFG